MSYWLLKSEPFKYSFDQLMRDKRTHWDGVRNYQAANNLRAMIKGDRAFFYHSNEGKEIVGIVKIVKTAYPDPSDASGKFVMVDIAFDREMKNPVNLAAMKSDIALKNMALIKQTRLSVVPIQDQEWNRICQLGGVLP